MKSILFVSASRLSQNLLRLVLSASRKKISVTSVDNLDEVGRLPQKGGPFSLVIVDWKDVTQKENWENRSEEWSRHQRLSQAKKILLYPRSVENPEENLGIWSGSFAKPFLAQELAEVILNHL